MKLSLNGALTIGTEDGSNIEMHQAITDQWWPFSFGPKVDENGHPYHPNEILQKDEPIRKAVETLRDDTFAETKEEKEAFLALYNNLVEFDPYRVLKDLRPYFEVQKKAEELFSTPLKWAETAIHNIAAMGQFSADESIRRYANEVWGIQPCPVDLDILAKVREEYSEHDRCKILNNSK